MKCHSYELFFEAFSNKTRMRIVQALMHSPKSVTEIINSVGEEQSTVSHNLKKLSQCNFLEFRVEGKQRIYSLNKDTIVPILELVERHVKTHCKGECLRKLK